MRSRHCNLHAATYHHLHFIFPRYKCYPHCCYIHYGWKILSNNARWQQLTTGEETENSFLFRLSVMCSLFFDLPCWSVQMFPPSCLHLTQLTQDKWTVRLVGRKRQILDKWLTDQMRGNSWFVLSIHMLQSLVSDCSQSSACRLDSWFARMCQQSCNLESGHGHAKTTHGNRWCSEQEKIIKNTRREQLYIVASGARVGINFFCTLLCYWYSLFRCFIIPLDPIIVFFFFCDRWVTITFILPSSWTIVMWPFELFFLPFSSVVHMTTFHVPNDLF